MESRIPKSFTILNPGASLRRRVTYSLVAVRLVLIPVIFLAGYYLFETGWIVARATRYLFGARRSIAQPETAPSAAAVGTTAVCQKRI